MPYSRVWTKNNPPGSQAASTADDELRNLREDIEQRMMDITNGWSTASPLDPITLRGQSTVLKNSGRLATVSAVEVSLDSLVLPASTLSSNGDLLRVSVRATSNGGSSTIRFKIGSVQLISAVVLTAGAALIEAYINRVALNIQSSIIVYLTSAATPIAFRAEPAESESSTITLDLRGFGDGVSELEIYGWTVELLRP